MHLNQLKPCKNETTKQTWGTCDNGEEAEGPKPCVEELCRETCQNDSLCYPPKAVTEQASSIACLSSVNEKVG